MWSWISERLRLLLVSRNVLGWGCKLSEFGVFPSPILLTPWLWLRVFGPLLHSAGGFSSILLSSRLVYASMAAFPVSIYCWFWSWSDEGRPFFSVMLTKSDSGVITSFSLGLRILRTVLLSMPIFSQNFFITFSNFMISFSLLRVMPRLLTLLEFS